MQRHSRIVHGHRRSYLSAGSGPPLLLVHGIGDSAATWSRVIPLLAKNFTVIAPDLLGHGGSDKPRADYSIGGFANGLRDLLAVLDIDRVTVVGHSLGGGIAMQFAYQYPELVGRLVLVSSGGLGSEVTPLLRVAALPGASTAIGLTLSPVARQGISVGTWLGARLGAIAADDAVELRRIWLGLRDRSTRAAFLRTLRGVIDVRGQTISSRDRVYLTAGVPTLLVWGDRDPVLPVAHVTAVADALPDARIEIVRGAGHVPHRYDPTRFAQAVTDFVQSTTPAVHNPQAWRTLVRAGDALTDQERISIVQHLTPPPALRSSETASGTG